MGHITGTTDFFVKLIKNGNGSLNPTPVEIDLSESIIASPSNAAADAQFAYTRHFKCPSDALRDNGGLYGLYADKDKPYLNPNSIWRQTQGYYYRTFPNRGARGWVYESDCEPRGYGSPRVMGGECGLGPILFVHRQEYDFYYCDLQKIEKLEKFENVSLKDCRYSNYLPRNMPSQPKEITLVDLMPIFEAIKQSNCKVTLHLPLKLEPDKELVIALVEIYSVRGDKFILGNKNNLSWISNLEATSKLIVSAQNEAQAANQRIKELTEALSVQVQSVQNLNRSISEKTAEVKLTSERNQVLNVEKTGNLQRIKDLIEEVSVQARSIQNLNQTLSGKTAELASLNEKYRDLKVTNEEITHQLMDQKSANLDLESSNKQLQEEKCQLELALSPEAIKNRDLWKIVRSDLDWAGLKDNLEEKEELDQEFRFLLKKGASIESIDENGLSPIYWCLLNRRMKMFSFLLGIGVIKKHQAPNLEAIGHDGRYIAETAIQLGLSQDSLKEVVALALVSHSDPEAKFLKALHAAVQDVFLKRWLAHEILCQGIKQGSLDLVKQAVDMKVDIDCLTKNGESPLDLACGNLNRSASIVEFLLSQGAIITKKTKKAAELDLGEPGASPSAFEKMDSEALKNHDIEGQKIRSLLSSQQNNLSDILSEKWKVHHEQAKIGHRQEIEDQSQAKMIHFVNVQKFDDLQVLAGFLSDMRKADESPEAKSNWLKNRGPAKLEGFLRHR